MNVVITDMKTTDLADYLRRKGGKWTYKDVFRSTSTGVVEYYAESGELLAIQVFDNAACKILTYISQ